MTKKSGAIHDKFLKRIMFNPDTAGVFFQEHLPENWSSRMVSERLERMPSDFIDEELAEHQSDVLYRIRLTNGKEGMVYILTDHKSSPDYKIALQLQRYMNKIWLQLAEKSNWRPLPEIWPVVIYNGNRSWNVPTNFAGLFETEPENPVQNIPDFAYHLIDLSQIPDDELSEQRRLRAFLTVMKHIQRPDFLNHTDTILAELRFLDSVDVLTILRYIIKKWTKDLDQPAFDALAVYIDPERKDEIMASVTQEWVDQGRVDEKVKSLIRLLEGRLGSISGDLKSKISKADANTIDGWFDKAINASKLDDVFKSMS